LRRVKHTRGTALVAAVVAASIVLGLGSAEPGRARPGCTHGASSIGPVYIKDGKVVGGDTTPHTEICLS